MGEGNSFTLFVCPQGATSITGRGVPPSSLGWVGQGVPHGGTYLGRGDTYLGRGYLHSTGGGYLPWAGGTYLGVPPLTGQGGYLPWMGVLTLGSPILNWLGVPTLGYLPDLAMGGTYLAQGTWFPSLCCCLTHLSQFSPSYPNIQVVFTSRLWNRVPLRF